MADPMGKLKIIALWMLVMLGIIWPPLLLIPAWYAIRAYRGHRRSQAARRDRWERGAYSRRTAERIIRAKGIGTL